MTLLPHFDVVDTAGRRVIYRAGIWQRKLLLLVTAPVNGHREEYQDIAADLAQLANDDVAVVVTADQVPGLPAGATVIADRWGEVAKVWAEEDRPPSVRELEEWMMHVRMRCPECEGEVK